MNNTLYMASRKGRTFNTHCTIEECKREADADAMENSRKRFEYMIAEVKELANTGLVSTVIGSQTIKGIKHGKIIEWNM